MEAFRSDAQQKLTRLRLIASRLDKEIAMKPDSSRADLHQCISQCTMSLDFSSSLILPSNCSQRILSKCYASNNPVNCTNGTCSSIRNESVSFRRTFHPNITLVSGIDIYRIDSFGNSLSDVQDGFSLICNRDLCNSPSTEISIQQIIQNSSSVPDIVQPDTTAITTTTVSNRCAFINIHNYNIVPISSTIFIRFMIS
ncbi:unnamed protein product [Rotaria magnacalcarata]|uniref:Uncharacterized protein n=1 Tax=Rotaria magnacalcarata TaxID=392030 RepID=A0A815XFQ0_9BILA|nr:unnamed protein product [Rotaria magnacalcarata]CAF1556927.1 unnamed protein product [Rotaria magnacalcarata]CAF3949019.1 unnamed protein product [Rotaria magnacalcarata]CAF4057537.1 unnamed protein product [Rotaria magnacalcarata]CAF4145340.1 unnamed protein product [Rotaria magnacalcarata]